MSNYPENIDAFSPVTGDTEMTEHAERHTAEESSIVAIETALGTNPEGDADTVADRLDAQDALIADNTQAIADIVIPDTSNFATKSEVEAADQTLQDEIDALPEPNTYKLETDGNTRSVPQIQLVDQDDEYSNVVFNAGDGISITSVASGLNFAVDTDIIPNTDDFATKTEVAEADATTLQSAEDYTDAEIGKIVIPDTSSFATKTELADADAATLDAAKSYTDSAIDDIEVPSTDNFATKTEVEEADAATLQAANDYTDEVQPDLATYATKTYVDDADAGLQQQIDQIEVYDDTDLTATVDSKFTMGGTWGELAGRA